MATLFIYDDEGTFQSVIVSDYENEQEAAVSLVETLIDWSNTELDDDEPCFPKGDIKAHISELRELIGNIKAHAVDLNEEDWHTTELGFTFSVA